MCPMGDIQNSVHGNYLGIPQNFVQLCNTEFREIPRNFRQFRTEYRSYGSTKNRRNSGLMEFRGHPIYKISQQLFTPTETIINFFFAALKLLINSETY